MNFSCLLDSCKAKFALPPNEVRLLEYQLLAIIVRAINKSMVCGLIGGSLLSVNWVEMMKKVLCRNEICLLSNRRMSYFGLTGV